MKKFLQYNIPFAGLKKGTHEFHFEINTTFFDQFEAAFVKDGKLGVKLSFHKQSNVSTLDFEIKGVVNVNCDRCLESFELPVETTEQLLIKFSENPREEEEIIYLYPGTEHINVAQYIYEFISLSLPMMRIHPDNEEGVPGCPPETLAYLNNEDESEDDDNDDNPFWSALQKFKE